jgi:hypothetical protein
MGQSCTPWWATVLSPDRARPGASGPEVEHAGVPPRTDCQRVRCGPAGVTMFGRHGNRLGGAAEIRTFYSLSTRTNGGRRHLGGGEISDNVRTPPGAMVLVAAAL